MISLVLGLIFIALGFCGIYIWHIELLVLLKGLIPLSFIFAGALGVIMGFSKLGDAHKSRDRG